MKTALITGISGQDGTFLAKLLLAKGYRVIGAVRNCEVAKEKLAVEIADDIELVAWDMQDQQGMIKTLTQYRPQNIYNFAAYSSGEGMYDNPVSIGEVNGLAVARILEAIRSVDEKIRFCQASSREIFGDALEYPQSESTPFDPRSPYGAAKLYADFMIRIYRQRYSIFACSAILYNHESPQRGLGFVTRKITNAAARIKLGLTKELHLGNLDAKRDWGFAGDFVRAMWLMLQQERADDYVLATGEVHSVRDICKLAFDYLEMDYRDYVREDEASYRPAELTLLVGDITKARTELGWQPKVSFTEMIRMMVDEDLRILSNSK